jgi:hypothetical protein
MLHLRIALTFVQSVCAALHWRVALTFAPSASATLHWRIALTLSRAPLRRCISALRLALIQRQSQTRPEGSAKALA